MGGVCNLLVSEGAASKISLFTAQRTSFRRCVQPFFDFVSVELVFWVFLEEIDMRGTFSLIGSVCTVLE